MCACFLVCYAAKRPQCVVVCERAKVIWEEKSYFHQKRCILQSAFESCRASLLIIHHSSSSSELRKKVSSVNKCKSQRLFFIWAFMWGVLCSPNHNSLNFYGIPKGQPKIPHFLSSNFIFLRWKHLPMYRKQTLEQCYSIFLFMAYFYFTAGVTKFKEKLDCRMDVVFFKSDWYNVWKLLNTYYSWNCIEIKKL